MGRTFVNRRSFLTTLPALAFLSWLAPKVRAAPKPRTIQIQESPLAGFQYHGGKRVWEEMRNGDPLDLVREPNNPYDRQAVALYWNNVKLGYVPRGENTAVAQMLDRGERLKARIVRLQESPNPWRRVRFRVDCELT